MRPSRRQSPQSPCPSPELRGQSLAPDGRWWPRVVQQLPLGPRLHGLLARPRAALCPACKRARAAAVRLTVPAAHTKTDGMTRVRGAVCLECGAYQLAPDVLRRVQALLAETAPAYTTPGMAPFVNRPPRVPVNLAARLQTLEGRCSDVRLLNLSLEGALIAHADPLSPGATCFLWLPLPGADLPLLAAAVWTRAYRPAKKESLPLRSGLHFCNPPAQARAYLQQLLAALRPGMEPSSTDGQ